MISRLGINVPKSTLQICHEDGHGVNRPGCYKDKNNFSDLLSIHHASQIICKYIAMLMVTKHMHNPSFSRATAMSKRHLSKSFIEYENSI